LIPIINRIRLVTKPEKKAIELTAGELPTGLALNSVEIGDGDLVAEGERDEDDDRDRGIFAVLTFLTAIR